MTPCAYYNEIDPYAAQWLRNLIQAGHIAPGYVDERSIEDVRPDDLVGFNQAHWFAGLGGWSLALRRAGWDDSRPAWTGSCPCQPFSAAGKGAGFADERHLWPAWQWLIEQCKPSVIFGEQVASKAVDPWIDLVHADLEALGYAFGSVPFPAAGVGAKFIGDRTYWVSVDPSAPKWNEQPRQEPRVGEAGRVGRIEQSVPWDRNWEDALSAFRALGYGNERCVGATDAARNAIVPQAAEQFIRAYL